MIISIEQIADGLMKVNDKPVHLDLDYSWISTAEMSSEERHAFQSFLKIKKDYPRLTKVVFTF